jgi:hypothetical protein
LGQLYFAIAGLAGDAGRNFHPEDIVARSFIDSDPFAAAVKKVEVEMQASLLNELTQMKAENEKDFTFETKPGTDTLGMVFAEVREGVPQLAGKVEV